MSNNRRNIQKKMMVELVVYLHIHTLRLIPMKKKRTNEKKRDIDTQAHAQKSAITTTTKISLLFFSL